jgi:two-component system NtrC family sensor kinase
MRILIADDDSITRKLLERIARDAGFDPIVVTNGNAAWEILSQDNPPRIVVLDWVMPGHSGIEVCAKLRSRIEAVYIYVLIVTSKIDTVDSLAGFEAGADDYIAKPIDRAQFLARLNAGKRIIQRERTLEDLLNRHQSVTCAIPSALIAINRHDRITEWNHVAAQLFGIPAAQAEGQLLLTLPIQWDWEQILVTLAKTADEGVLNTIHEAAVRRPSGEYFFVDIVCSLIFDNKQRPSGVLLVASDVTARKNLHEQLNQVNKLEAVGQLAAGIAHEINTPTQCVLGNLEYLQDVVEEIRTSIPDIAPLKEFLTKTPEIEDAMIDVPRAIERSLLGIKQVSDIIHAMNNFAHPGASTAAPTDLNAALEDILIVSHSRWKEVAEVEKHFEENLPSLHCFTAEINQVFLNIIVNAAHAIEERPAERRKDLGKIVISTTLTEPYITITVSDNGCGIPEDIRHKVFEPFFTTKEAGRGTGQGLALAHRVIVGKHEGTIEVESEVGKGTTFTIQLPLAGPAEKISPLHESRV